VTWLDIAGLLGLFALWAAINIAADRGAKWFVHWRAGRCRALLRQRRCGHGRVRELCDDCGGAA